jgi:cation diffusion facilitator CzcD-associated flavoprotein CzcO
MAIGMLEWLIIGGGVHGTHLSHVMVHARGVPSDRIRVLDREREPLAAFWRCVEATGMTYLRSPGVHHLDLHPYSLLHFAQREGRRLAGFVPPSYRPKLPLFRAHCEHVVDRYRLADLRLVACTEQITVRPWGYRIETDEGCLDTRRVVLALGTGDELEVPMWARGTDPSWHVFHHGFARERVTPPRTVAIIGGGISAAQLMLALARDGLQPIVVARHPIREHRFDSDPAWLGPQAMQRFARSAPAARRAQIREARHRGSLPPELRRAVKRATRAGLARWIEAEVTALDRLEIGIQLFLDRTPHVLVVDHVILATGFRGVRPGGALIDDAIDKLGLPCAACGFPILRDTLEWRPGLYVSGALAELELGPTARNIAGARAAGGRLARVADP